LKSYIRKSNASPDKYKAHFMVMLDEDEIYVLHSLFSAGPAHCISVAPSNS